MPPEPQDSFPAQVHSHLDTLAEIRTVLRNAVSPVLHKLAIQALVETLKALQGVLSQQ